jgi:MSHA biogenesis protein MshO
MGYAGGNYPTVSAITPAGATITITPGSDEDAVFVSSSANFPADSSTRTLFVLDGPVKYLCNTTAGVNTLTRYELYAMTPALVVAAPAGVPAQLVARDVTSCAITAVPGDATHSDLILLELTISRNGETLRVMHQVSVESLQ